jgi:hypothetical protein
MRIFRSRQARSNAFRLAYMVLCLNLAISPASNLGQTLLCRDAHLTEHRTSAITRGMKSRNVSGFHSDARHSPEDDIILMEYSNGHFRKGVPTEPDKANVS